jgi:hypothetical protein
VQIETFAQHPRVVGQEEVVQYHVQDLATLLRARAF